MTVTVTKLEKDSIYETLNIGSNWIPKNEGCRITHIPTRSVIECVDHDSYRENVKECKDRLEQIIKWNC